VTTLFYGLVVRLESKAIVAPKNGREESMKYNSIILIVGLIAAVGLGFYVSSGSPQESGMPAKVNTMIENRIGDMLPNTGSLLLVQDRYDSNYGPYHELPSDWRNEYGIYALPSYDVLREYFKRGGYIGSELFRSKRELYKECLIYSRYTYECQIGQQWQ
jgi:hypothetical protein